MKLLQDVYGGYADSVAGHQTVPGQPSTQALRALKFLLPAFFNSLLVADGRTAVDYRVYGRYGEPNRSFASVPWVATCARTVTSSVTKGYFIVLLFRSDMSGCWLSLNQGYKQYEDAFASQRAARRQARIGADALSRWIAIPDGFLGGPIDLGASTDRAKGYEAGAIVSKFYSAGDTAEALLESDFGKLLRIYDQLRSSVGASVVDILPYDETAFQNAASELAKASTSLPHLPPGPLPAPSKSWGSRSDGYRRDPKIAARALRNANYLCELDARHSTFIGRKTGHNFVEAHHLILLSEQSKHPHNLDVPENVVALCPNCHRFLHHGRTAERVAAAMSLFKDRAADLVTRGVTISEADLRALYRHEIEVE